MALRIPGRQVAPVRTEAEDEELSIVSRAKSYDFQVVGDEPDLDCPVAEQERIARHGGVEGNIEGSRGPVNSSTGGSQVGQGQAGDRLVAKRIDPPGWQLQVPGNRSRLGQSVEAAEPLSQLATMPLGACLGRERLEKPFAAPCLCALDIEEVPADLVALVVEGPGRQRRADGDDGRQDRSGDVSPGQPGVAAAPPPELFDCRASSGLDWSVAQETLQVSGHLSRSLASPTRL